VRAIFTAFSTASAPVEKSAVFFPCAPGVRRLRRSATSRYPSYSVTRKQVCVKRAACAAIAATTAGCDAPTLVTAIPDAKSMSWFPSASRRIAPDADSMKIGSV
jgi:hypothetical protein